MSESTSYGAKTFEDALTESIALQRLPMLARYMLSFFLVVAATLFAAAMQGLVSASNVALMYVLPVVIAASYCGWGASLFAVALSVLAFDFFFTEPYYTLTMTNPPEIWATALLLVIATLVASIAADGRRRALDAAEAVSRMAALQSLAHAVVHGDAPDTVMSSAAATLQRLFQGPSIIYVRRGSGVDVAAHAGGARDTEKEREAALGALSNRQRTWGENYPFPEACFDFWPVLTSNGDFMVGVDFSHASLERPAATESLIESVAGYIAAALRRDGV